MRYRNAVEVDGAWLIKLVVVDAILFACSKEYTEPSDDFGKGAYVQIGQKAEWNADRLKYDWAITSEYSSRT